MSAAEVAAAEARAEAARMRLADTLGMVQVRLEPRTLARSALRSVEEGGTRAIEASGDAVARNPLPLVGGAALLVAFLARKPIAAACRRVRGR